jgi:hypothetical protein
MIDTPYSVPMRALICMLTATAWQAHEALWASEPCP